MGRLERALHLSSGGTATDGYDTCADSQCDTDPFAEADEDTGETKQSGNYIHIRIQRKS